MRTGRSSNKVFIIIIALLLISNIATIIMMNSNRKPVDDHKGAMRNYLQKEIGFSAQQLQEFDTIKSIHRREVKPIFEQMRENKKSNLQKLGASGFSDSALAATASAAASEQQAVELKLLRHIRDIRNICTPSQRAVFDTGFYKVMSKPAPDAKKKEK
jgi:Spy/CpxP family protein refolding chaperone